MAKKARNGQEDAKQRLKLKAFGIRTKPFQILFNYFPIIASLYDSQIQPGV